MTPADVLGTSQGSTGLPRGRLGRVRFVLVGAYIFVDAMNSATGGNALPLGRPVLH